MNYQPKNVILFSFIISYIAYIFVQIYLLEEGTFEVFFLILMSFFLIIYMILIFKN